MPCRRHPSQTAVSSCSVCHERFCSDCLIVGRQVRCLQCAQALLDRADGRPAPEPAGATGGPRADQKRGGVGPIFVLFGAVIALGLAAPMAPHLLGLHEASPQRALSGFLVALAEADYARAESHVHRAAVSDLDLAEARARLRLDGSEPVRVHISALRLSRAEATPVAVATVRIRSAKGQEHHSIRLRQAGESWKVVALDSEPLPAASSCPSRERRCPERGKAEAWGWF